MSNTYFQFKQFTVQQDQCAMKVTTDGCLFGAWAAKQVVQQFPDAKTIADIGTGTGLLSLMLAQETDARIQAIEIDPAAAEQAGDNCKQSPWNEKLTVSVKDIKEVPVTGYDIMISNPPFYENDLRSGAGNKNLAHHDAGLLLHELVTIFQQQLNPAGLFFLLLPYKRENEVLTLLQQANLAPIRITQVKQSDSHGYFRTMLMGTHQANAQSFVKEEISIRDKTNNYTDAFIRLLQPYYLHL